ncbi:hypothetical protein [Neobacillus cucumis]|nr:hypothetical protein [Neobacillus cucumis]MDR4946044.1 hypothetical protein [Neobacillus cucumis]
MKIFGYVCVSSIEQNEARQMETMRKEGILMVCRKWIAVAFHKGANN